MSHVETTDDEDFFPLLIPDFTSFGSDIYVVSTLLFYLYLLYTSIFNQFNI